jgi:hypothetical protein
LQYSRISDKRAGMTRNELGKLFKSIQIRRQIGQATKEDNITLENIQKALGREANRLMPEVLIAGGTPNDAMKRACKKLGLPWEFFQK